MNSDTSILQIKGVGEKTAGLFKKLGITTVGELLRHYPGDYESFKEPVPVSEAEEGEVCAVRVCVMGIPNLRKVRNLAVLNVDVQDAWGKMQLTFYNMPYLKKVLRQGGVYIFRGLVQSRGRLKIMEQPKLYSEKEYRDLITFIQPRYSLTAGLTNRTVSNAVRQALSFYEFGPEYYPDDIIRRYGLISEKEAVSGMHFPSDRDELVRARKRVVFDEFFLFLLMMRRDRDEVANLTNCCPMRPTEWTEHFLSELPFDLTGAQKKVWNEVEADLEGPLCMNRMIQGDVGSGKTIVAVLALLECVCSGYQGAMMAPTEVLARQHFATVNGYTEKYGLPFRPVLLTGSMTEKEKSDCYDKIRTGGANLIIGTHALIQSKVSYKNLALVITDEQHRFGVRQREMLTGKGEGGSPHVLVMSATPIPRTLALILYGDLHISVIDEMPANRLPIKNCVVNVSYRPTAYKFIADQIAGGRQAYVICPLIDEGEGGSAENVMDYTEKLRAIFPADVRVEPLHGRMKSAQKDRIMEEFAAGDINVLVSTTVIEVGVDVPNATVMMVENAERFGLAQLHQLRGRVGRGKWQSYCIFVSSSTKKETMERLDILNRSNDGFEIASRDLKLRGPGDLFGVRQSGDFSFRVGDIYADADILSEASEAVDEIMADDPCLKEEKNRLLREHVEAALPSFIDFRSL